MDVTLSEQKEERNVTLGPNKIVVWDSARMCTGLNDMDSEGIVGEGGSWKESSSDSYLLLRPYYINNSPNTESSINTGNCMF